MRIEKREGKYFLGNGVNLFALATLMLINDDVKDISHIYEDLTNKELGSYEEIMGKTFVKANNSGSVCCLSQKFVKFIEETRKMEEKPKKKPFYLEFIYGDGRRIN